MGLSTPESDVDVLTVVNPNETTPEAVIRFARAQVILQLEFGRRPDRQYPADVISSAQLKDSIDGRCIVDENGALVNDQNTNEFDYRVWLYELITHNFDLLGGDESALETATGKALETALIISAVRESLSQINIDSLRKTILKPTEKKEYILGNAQTEMLISRLQKSVFAGVRKGIVEIDQNMAKELLKELLSFPRSSVNIVPWSDLRQAVI